MGNPLSPSYVIFASYLKDGVVIVLPNSVAPCPIARLDTGFGSWKPREEANQYDSAFVARAYDASGQAIKMIKINASFRLADKDNMEVNGKLMFCDLDMLNCIPDSLGFSTLRGTRL